MIADLSSEDLSFLEQSLDPLTDGRTTVEVNILARLRNRQIIMVEWRDRANHHPTADDAVRRAWFDGEARRQEWHRVEWIVRHDDQRGGGWQDW